MTWGELKKRIEYLGVIDTDEVDYIDLSCGGNESFEVVIEPYKDQPEYRHFCVWE